MKYITLGCDPELFLEDNKGNIVSAEGLIGGTKHAPRVFTEEGHSVQEDNIMVEFNIPPSKTSDEFIENINLVKDYLKDYVSQYDLKLNYLASSIISKEYLNTKQAKTFGCEPDFNVYLRDLNCSPNSNTQLRSCGGHIHIGYPNPDVETSEKIVIAMDMFLGLPSVWLDKDNKRRLLYGKAGSFRVKSFGVEYRTLSNFWIKDNKSMKWAFDETVNAVMYALNNDMSWLSKYYNDVQTVINESNVDGAKQLYSTIHAEIASKVNNKTKVKKTTTK